MKKHIISLIVKMLIILLEVIAILQRVEKLEVNKIWY